MATTWQPVIWQDREWLLTDGSVVKTPPLEQTSTGRKTRIAGTSTSVYHNDTDDMIWTHVQKQAQERKTKVWMPVQHLPCPSTPSLHFSGGGQWRGSTSLWWLFRHPTLPVTAMVTLTMSAKYNRANDTGQGIECQVHLPSTDLKEAHTRQGRWVIIRDDLRNAPVGVFDLEPGEAQALEVLQAKLAVDGATWSFSNVLSAETNYPNSRSAVAEFLRRARIIDDAADLAVPDLRNTKKPALLVLEAVETNFNGEFTESLASYLDSEPMIDRALQAYKEFQDAMREIGITFEGIGKDDLLAALDHSSDAVRVDVGHPDSPTGKDTQHTLRARLATGTFIVECELRAQATNTDKDKIALHWEEARTIASLTGQEPELLAYARAYANQSEERRAGEILRAHK